MQRADASAMGSLKGNAGPGAFLKGSMGEPIKTSASGPRLSTEGPMRDSAEKYLKGSTEVCSFELKIIYAFAFCSFQTTTKTPLVIQPRHIITDYFFKYNHKTL